MTDEELELDLSTTSEPMADWDWARAEDETASPALPAEAVVAILVAHQAAEWLPRTLQAIGRLDPRPGTLVGVAVESSDETAEQLTQAVADGLLDQVVAAPATGFGQAVQAGLTALNHDPELVWLLHDDLEPQPDSLQGLLRRAAAEPRPDLMFPKLVGPRRRNHPNQLLEIGQSISPTGARMLSVEPGDIDQLQLDSSATLGGSSAGLLVRGDAWQQLGGFDPDLPLFRDALDLGWRANDAGLSVVTAPEAALHHHQRGRWGDRHSPIADSLPALDRLTGLRLVAARSSHPGASRVRLWLSSLLQALVMVIGKNPAAAASCWRSGWQIMTDGAAVARVRTRIGSSPATDQSALRPTRRRRMGEALSLLAGSFTDRYRELRDDSDTSLDDLIGDDFTGGRSRAQLIAPLTAALVAVAVLSLVAGRRLLGAGQLTSLQLAAAPSSLTAAFQAWLHPAPGHPGPNAPWLGLAALGSTVTAGRPEVWARVVVIGAPLWAALAMVVLARALLGTTSFDRRMTAVAALAWGVLVAALGLPARGSISAIAVAVLAPLALSAALAWFRQDRPDAATDLPSGELWRAPGLLALWLGLLGTAQPLIWPAAAVIAVIHAVSCRRFSPRTVAVGLGPLLLSAPWLVRLADQPGRLLTGADPTVTPADFAPRPLALALGRLGEGDAPTAFATIAIGVLWLAALALAVRGLRGGLAAPAALLATALAAVAVASILSRFVVTLDGVAVRPAADPWVTLAVLALLAATLWGLSELGLWRRLAVVALAVSIMAAGIGWQWVTSAGPAQVSPSRLPAHVTAVQDSARGGRALMIDVHPEGTGWTLSSSTQPQWGSGELNPAGGNHTWVQVLGPLVVQIASANPPEDLAARLAGLGISHLWLANGTPNQVNGLTNTAGLVAARSDATTVIYTVSGLVSRAAVLTPDGQLQPLVEGQIPAGTSGQVVIAEPHDPRWRVTIDGRQVPSAPVEPIGLRVNATGASGELSWSTAASTWAAVWEGAILLVLLVMAAPTVGRRRLTGDGARFEESR